MYCVRDYFSDRILSSYIRSAVDYVSTTAGKNPARGPSGPDNVHTQPQAVLAASLPTRLGRHGWLFPHCPLSCSVPACAEHRPSFYPAVSERSDLFTHGGIHISPDKTLTCIGQIWHISATRGGRFGRIPSKLALRPHRLCHRRKSGANLELHPSSCEICVFLSAPWSVLFNTATQTKHTFLPPAAGCLMPAIYRVE